MICPQCHKPLGWIGDFTCDEVTGCECENGVVGFYACSHCKTQVQITTNCSTDEE